MITTLKKLSAIPSVSGRESKLASLLVELATPYVDDVKIDALGNVIAHKASTRPDAKKLMLAAHIDEIGFMVNDFTDDGYVRLANLGGVSLIAASYSVIVFENGVRGVLVPETGTAATDYRIDKFVCDIGATSKKDASKRLRIGDCACYEPNLTRLHGNLYAGHPIDDKIGAVVLLETMKSLSESNADCAYDTYFVFTVQEEVGCRGSKTAAFAIAPDYSLAFDVTGTGDTVGAKPMAVKVGGGAAIKIKDSSVICDAEMVERLTKLAEEKKIKHQHEILLAGGTDTSSMQMAGVGSVAGAISIPTRYIHTPHETFSVADVKACVELASAFICE